MTIADDNKKPKARKKAAGSRNALAELQAAMTEKIATTKAEAAKKKPEAVAKKPEPPAKRAAPEVAPTEIAALKPAPEAKPAKAPGAQPKTPAAAPRWLDPAAMSALLIRIAERTQKLIQEYAERHKSSATLPSDIDPARIAKAFGELTNRLLNTPERFVDAQLAFWQDYARLWQTALTRLAGQKVNPFIAPAANDKRFQDPAWQDVWLFDFIKQSYLLTARWAQSLVQKADGLEPKMARKIDFYTRQMVDAISPSNFWMTNPEVLRATVETGGENLIKGLEHLLNDLDRGQGRLAISMTNPKSFRFGENIATSKGKVVFQNELMQLIQYAPVTEKAHKTPLLIVPPWINKYYILDLREKNSFIHYMVEQGHTVFCISWVNPDSRHAHINFDDYMTLGLLAAIKDMARITGVDEVNVVGYCIGGTLLASTLAYLNALGKKRPKDIPTIVSATYLVTLVDFAEPGDLGVFMDEEQITALEARMAKLGYLDAPVMATTFNLLRSNDLIWSFVVNNYLMGREPFPFDLLYWNADSTNLPASMQSYYLRNMYLQNKLVQPGGVEMKGVAIDLTSITTPSFLLSTRDDHIAPWRSTYAATQLYKGPVTFVLSGSGHIAGIINPPVNNKYGYWTNAKCPAHPDDWLKDAEAHDGSWWPEWLNWLKPFAGPMVPAREPTNALEEAPGSYVRVQVL